MFGYLSGMFYLHCAKKNPWEFVGCVQPSLHNTPVSSELSEGQHRARFLLGCQLGYRSKEFTGQRDGVSCLQPISFDPSLTAYAPVNVVISHMA